MLVSVPKIFALSTIMFIVKSESEKHYSKEEHQLNDTKSYYETVCPLAIIFQTCFHRENFLVVRSYL